MKITILQGAFLPIPPVLGGGGEKMWYALALDFARRGHEVVYVSRTYPGMPAEEWLQGVHHRRVKGYDWPTSIVRLKWLDLLYSLRAKKVIPQDTDVLVTNTFWSPLLVSAQLKKRCLVDVARMPKGQMRLYFQAGLLRANSSPVAAAIRQELPVRQHGRVVTIPNPLPFTSQQPINFDEKKPILLYTGRLHPEKGLHLLIEAFKALRTNWKLKIVGPWDKSAGGGGVDYLEDLKRLAGNSAIEYTGPIHDTALLNRYYAEASLFVYPSVAEKGETFGLSPLEAMSWGCLPLVSDLACFQDFIEHQRNGLIFDHRRQDATTLLSSMMEQLIGDAPYRISLAKEALRVRNSHSTAFIASRFLEAFEQLTEPQKTTQAVLI